MTYRQMVKEEHLTTEEQYAKAMTLLESIDPEVISSIEYEIASKLRAFHYEINAGIKANDFHMIEKAVYLKTKSLRHMIEKMIALHDGFKLEGIIPFEYICTKCSGAGVILKFFRKVIEVDCKYCDKDPETKKPNGYRTVSCRDCHGTGKYKKADGEKITCTRCKGVGKVTFACNKCLNTGIFKIHPIDAKVKSVTQCKHCNSLGFISDQPLPKRPPKKLMMERKVSKSPLTQNLGILLKAAEVQQEK